MEDLTFTEEEVIRELAKFGYYNVPPETINAFRRELEDVVREDRSQNSSLATTDLSYDQAAAFDTLQSKRTAEVQHSINQSSNHSSYQLNSGSYHHPISRDIDYEVTYNRPQARASAHSDASLTNRITKSTENDPLHWRLAPHSSEEVVNGVPLKSCLKKTVPKSSSDDDCGFRYGGVGFRGAVDDVISATDDMSETSSTGTEQRIIKRKVLRKQNGRVEIHNESITENDSELSYLGDQMKGLSVNVLNNRPMSAPPASYSVQSGNQQSHSACREHLNYNLPDGYHGLKALIRPMSCEPHMRNIKKSDPVSRYQRYKQSWNSCRAPGERSHKQLRWDIREQMLQQDDVVIKRPQPVHQPNRYVVPGDKKRKTLRWQIRNDLAQGIKPPSIFD